MGEILAPLIPQFIASTVVLGVVALLARWVYLALAVTGLHGGEVSAGWLVGRGLRAMAAEMVLMLAFLAVALGMFLVVTSAGIGVALLLGLAVGGVVLYLQVRVAFWSLAIFDGAGITEGLIRSWRMSEGAVTRMIGWALAVAGIGLLVNIAGSMVTFPLSNMIPLQSGVKAGVTELYAVFQLFTLAVMYESQLRRTLPQLAAPGPAYAAAAPVYAPSTNDWTGFAPVATPPPDPDGPPLPPPPPSAPPAPPASPPRDPWRG